MDTVAPESANRRPSKAPELTTKIAIFIFYKTPQRFQPRADCPKTFWRGEQSNA
jgi:hypothetical protein